MENIENFGAPAKWCFNIKVKNNEITEIIFKEKDIDVKNRIFLNKNHSLERN